MRLAALTLGLLAIVAATGIAATPALAHHRVKVVCLCHCPRDHRVVRHVVHHAEMRMPVRHVRHRYTRAVEDSYYRYASAPSVREEEWHGAWHVAPRGPVESYEAPPPAYPDYGPPADCPPDYGMSQTYAPAVRYGDYERSGMRVDDWGWSGGVGATIEGGNFVDGYGQMHFGQGGRWGNASSYNGYRRGFSHGSGMGVHMGVQGGMMGGYGHHR